MSWPQGLCKLCAPLAAWKMGESSTALKKD